MDIAAFAEALASKDVNRYSAWFADDIRLYTPAQDEAIAGRPAVSRVLPVIFSLFEGFHYPDVVAGQETHALFFRAQVNGVPLEGIDYIRVNGEGKVSEFTVMIRPLPALMALSQAVAARMQGGPRPPAP
jgi:hypothetical protein